MRRGRNIPPHSYEDTVKKIIHVNQHIIKSNSKTSKREPVLTVKQGRKNTYASEVIIDGPSKVVYSPDSPLSCGAKVWIETEADVTLINAKQWSDLK